MRRISLVATIVSVYVLPAMSAAEEAMQKNMPDRGRTVLLEAEAFSQLGGWVVDQQFMDQMGSPFLLAHGLGEPVADAASKVTFPTPGTYHVWVRTRDWAASWTRRPQGTVPTNLRSVPSAAEKDHPQRTAPLAAEMGLSPSAPPGRFQVLINGKPLATVFGAEGAAWHWQPGGTVQITEKQTKIALHDLTGFDGRCDAVLFSLDDLVPPNRDPEMRVWRRRLLGLPKVPPDAGQFDLVVVGGGIAGCTTAVSAARLGVRVALIQDRPVLGGNNSSEIRVGLAGLVHLPPYPHLGDLVDELSPVGHWTRHDAVRNPNLPRSREILEIIRKDPERAMHNGAPASNYEDEKKLRVVQGEPNVSLFLNMHVCGAEKDGRAVRAVTARNIRDGRELRFPARWFADCTGDGTVGYLAGADFRVGRESRAETGESLAPEAPDALTMGSSVQWYAAPEEQPSRFPECPWALQFNAKNVADGLRGDWDWEAGIGRDQIGQFEQIRDLGLRAAYGNWAFLKNHSPYKERYANARLSWVAYVGGKRESRRLLGDVILQEQDIRTRKPYPDACVTTTWSIDLHLPNPKNSAYFPGQEFRAVAKQVEIKPYAIPYRCLYSRNVENLFMAGRDISVTHVALGTVRVQRTTGMMGEVVGMAAGICKRRDTTPRGVYENNLDELKELMSRGVGRTSR